MSTPEPSTPPHQFLNCEMEFECPKNWFELTETDKAGIKHCSTCDKHVPLCITQHELDALAHQGECIAFFSDPDLSTRFKLSREKAEANRKDREFRIERITLGLPRSGSRGQLKSFLEEIDTENKKKPEDR